MPDFHIRHPTCTSLIVPCMFGSLLQKFFLIPNMVSGLLLLLRIFRQTGFDMLSNKLLLMPGQVTHGSILCRTLFLLYINDFAGDVIRNIAIYVDVLFSTPNETQLLIHGYSLNLGIVVDMGRTQINFNAWETQLYCHILTKGNTNCF